MPSGVFVCVFGCSGATALMLAASRGCTGSMRFSARDMRGGSGGSHGERSC